MAENTRKRRGELLRKLFEILQQAPDGLPASVALERLAGSMPLTEFEAGVYEMSGARRFDKIVRFAQPGAGANGAGGESETADDIQSSLITFEQAEEQAWGEIEAHVGNMDPWYREFQSKAPDEFYIFLGLQTVPPGDPFPKEHWGKKMCVLLVSHNGAIVDAEKAVNAVRASLPKPIIDWAGAMPYPALQSLFDGLYPKGLQWYWKGDFVQSLPDAAIEAHLAHTAKLPSAISGMHLYPIDGAVHRRKQAATAWNCRDATWSMVIVGVDADPANAPALKKWARDYWEAVHPFDFGGAYPNFMMDDEGEARLKATFGGNYPRLAALKKRYDPGNLFRVNQNIRPAA